MEPKIQWKPFKMEFANWLQTLGIFLIILGVAVVSADSRMKGYKKGLQDEAEFFKDAIQKEVEKMETLKNSPKT